MLTKDTNPKDAVGTRKVGTHFIPSNIIMKLGLALHEGARKYGAHNWRVAGVRASVYYDAAMRHMMAWWEGEDIDPDSGLPHLVKAMACFAVIQDAIDNDNWVDDRPPSLKPGWINALNKKASDLIDRWPDAKEPYTKFHSDFKKKLEEEPLDYSVLKITWGDEKHESVIGNDFQVGDIYYIAERRPDIKNPLPPVWSPEYQSWMNAQPVEERDS